MAPQLFEYQTVAAVPRGKLRAHNMQRAAVLCEGCTVVSQCARQAIELKATGIIQAGISIPPMNKLPPGAYTRALEEIARGVEPARAARAHIRAGDLP